MNDEEIASLVVKITVETETLTRGLKDAQSQVTNLVGNIDSKLSQLADNQISRDKSLIESSQALVEAEKSAAKQRTDAADLYGDALKRLGMTMEEVAKYGQPSKQSGTAAGKDIYGIIDAQNQFRTLEEIRNKTKGDSPTDTSEISNSEKLIWKLHEEQQVNLELAALESERAKASAGILAEAEKLTLELEKQAAMEVLLSDKELKRAQQQVAGYHASGLSPEQIAPAERSLEILEGLHEEARLTKEIADEEEQINSIVEKFQVKIEAVTARLRAQLAVSEEIKESTARAAELKVEMLRQQIPKDLPFTEQFGLEQNLKPAQAAAEELRDRADMARIDKELLEIEQEQETVRAKAAKDAEAYLDNVLKVTEGLQQQVELAKRLGEGISDAQMRAAAAKVEILDIARVSRFGPGHEGKEDMQGANAALRQLQALNDATNQAKDLADQAGKEAKEREKSFTETEKLLGSLEKEANAMDAQEAKRAARTAGLGGAPPGGAGAAVMGSDDFANNQAVKSATTMQQLNELYTQGRMSQEAYNESLKRMQAEADAATTALGKMVIGWLGFLGLKQGIMSTFEAFSGMQQATIRLTAATEANGYSIDALKDRYADFAKQMRETLGVVPKLTYETLAQANAYGISGEAAIRVTEQALALQKVQGGSADQWLMVARAVEEGNAQMLFHVKAVRGIHDQADKLAAAQKFIASNMEQAADITNTTRGQIDKLGGSFAKLSQDIGGVVDIVLKPLVYILSTMVELFNQIPDSIRPFIATLIAVGIAAGPVIAAYKMMQVQLLLVISSLKAGELAALSFAKALLMNPWTWVIVGIIALTELVGWLRRSGDEADAASDKINKMASLKALDREIKEIKESPNSSDAYQKLKGMDKNIEEEIARHKDRIDSLKSEVKKGNYGVLTWLNEPLWGDSTTVYGKLTKQLKEEQKGLKETLEKSGKVKDALKDVDLRSDVKAELGTQTRKIQLQADIALHPDWQKKLDEEIHKYAEKTRDKEHPEGKLMPPGWLEEMRKAVLHEDLNKARAAIQKSAIDTRISMQTDEESFGLSGKAADFYKTRLKTLAEEEEKLRRGGATDSEIANRLKLIKRAFDDVKDLHLTADIADVSRGITKHTRDTTESLEQQTKAFGLTGAAAEQYKYELKLLADAEFNLAKNKEWTPDKRKQYMDEVNKKIEEGRKAITPLATGLAVKDIEGQTRSTTQSMKEQIATFGLTGAAAERLRYEMKVLGEAEDQLARNPLWTSDQKTKYMDAVKASLADTREEIAKLLPMLTELQSRGAALDKVKAVELNIATFGLGKNTADLKKQAYEQERELEKNAEIMFRKKDAGKIDKLEKEGKLTPGNAQALRKVIEEENAVIEKGKRAFIGRQREINEEGLNAQRQAAFVLDSLEKQKGIVESGYQLTKEMMTPQEKLADRKRDLEEMFNSGAISADVYTKSLQKASETTQKLAMQDAVLAGGAESLRRVAEFREKVQTGLAINKPGQGNTYGRLHEDVREAERKLRESTGALAEGTAAGVGDDVMKQLKNAVANDDAKLRKSEDVLNRVNQKTARNLGDAVGKPVAVGPPPKDDLPRTNKLLEDIKKLMEDQAKKSGININWSGIGGGT